MELKHRDRLALTADKLSVHVGDKQILFDVSTVARSGSLMAIMGPSGSGKTTFMNTISGRHRLSSGTISMNGKPVSTRMRKSFGYVTQTDVFFPMLTLRQTVEFAARVKLPDSFTAADRQQRIHQVIESLELEKCLDTVMGNFMMPGLSGGEKKRANVACELLPNPDVLLLDEPTSGLDASLALTLIELLRSWSTKEDKVVIMSIHQPSSQIFHVFDDLLLLTDGHTAYFGQQDGMVDYFDGIGLTFEPLWNPADYMLELVKQSSDNKKLIIQKGSQFSELLQAAHAPNGKPAATEPAADIDGSDGGHVNAAFDETAHATIEMKSADADPVADADASDSADVEFTDGSAEADKAGWGRQLLALTLRGFQVGRTRYLSPEPIVRTGFVGLMSSLLWFQISRTEEHIRDITGCIFFIVTNLSFAPLFEAIMAFHEDIHIVKHERRAGMYQIGAFYVSKMITEIPLLVAVPFLTLTLVFWTAGLGGFLQYLPFVLAILFNSMACQGIGVFIGLLTDIPKANLTIAFIFMMFSLLLGGFFTTSVPVWLVWGKYLSFIRYCFHFCFLTVFVHSPNFLCAQSVNSSYQVCTDRIYVNAMNQSELPTSEILKHYPEQMLRPWENFGIILVFLVVFRVAGYLWLRFMKKA